jgi:hypothetical protein
MHRTYESNGGVRHIVAAFIVIALLPCEDVALAAQASAGPPESSQRSSGGKNADRARRLVAAAGIGGRADVTLRRGERLLGEIREIEDEYFVLVLDAGSAANIKYADIQRFGPIVLKPASPGRRIARDVVGAAGVVLFIITAIRECSGRSC